MRWWLPLLPFVVLGCDKKPPIVGTYEGTATVSAHGGAVDVKQDFTDLQVSLQPMVKQTPNKKPYESETEVTITLENGPFTKPCVLDGLYAGVKNEVVIASALHPRLCAMRVDTWTNNAVAISPSFELFSPDEVHASEATDLEGNPQIFLKIELRLTRKR